MTKSEEKQIIRVCGKDYTYWDIPPAIRKREDLSAPEILKPMGYKEHEVMSPKDVW